MAEGSISIEPKRPVIGLICAEIFRNYLYFIERFGFNQSRSQFQTDTLWLSIRHYRNRRWSSRGMML